MSCLIFLFFPSWVDSWCFWLICLARTLANLRFSKSLLRLQGDLNQSIWFQRCVAFGCHVCDITGSSRRGSWLCWCIVSESLIMFLHCFQSSLKIDVLGANVFYCFVGIPQSFWSFFSCVSFWKRKLNEERRFIRMRWLWLRIVGTWHLVRLNTTGCSLSVFQHIFFPFSEEMK